MLSVSQSKLTDVARYGLEIPLAKTAKDKMHEICVTNEFARVSDTDQLLYAVYATADLPNGVSREQLYKLKPRLEDVLSRELPSTDIGIYTASRWFCQAALLERTTGEVPDPKNWLKGYPNLGSSIRPGDFNTETVSMLVAISEAAFWACVTYPNSEIAAAADGVRMRVFDDRRSSLVPELLKSPAGKALTVLNKLKVLASFKLCNRFAYGDCGIEIDWQEVLNAFEETPADKPGIQLYATVLLADKLSVHGPGGLVMEILDNNPQITNSEPPVISIT